MTPSDFIARWEASGGAELANSQSFLKELCALLDVPQPEPTQADESRNTYVFEKAVTFNNGDGTTSTGRVDLYCKGCFVLESKQGSERKAAEQAEALATETQRQRYRSGTAERGTPAWDQAMVKARQQARRYAEALPDEWPPFLAVVDVGFCIDLYADFAQSGKNYVPFPDPHGYRIRLAKLEDSGVREMLRAMWLDPHSLDPSGRSARVTRELAERLARLAKSLEAQTGRNGEPLHTAETVARFLMRCLFTMFAEDVELIERRSFTQLLESLRDKPETFAPMVKSLWETMNAGGFSPILRTQVKQFNGGLFEDCAALPLNRDQLQLLIEASKSEWNEVEPAIFGTLLERALDSHERHKLGAHFTPRAYVERLVMHTVMEPLRRQWEDSYATAVQLHSAGKSEEAVTTIRRFHGQLCEICVLDPACGSGNFLYVSLELMKRLEGEVLNSLREFGENQLPLLTIDPHQFLGIEVNPRAAAITDLVLWIGYLQWHFRTRGRQPVNEPIIRKLHNIECRDAVLTWDSVEPVLDEDGYPVTRWDGRTYKNDPVTGSQIPDETVRVQELRYNNPRKSDWPVAAFIVGNPPFIGNKRMRESLGDGYVKTIRAAYDDVPESVDYVMYWWDVAAAKVENSEARRFGLITTNSITQTFNSRLVHQHLDSEHMSICYAIPDHPWVDATDGADVRIAMTVGCSGTDTGVVDEVISERPGTDGTHIVQFRTHCGVVVSDLSVGLDAASLHRLKANRGLACPGVQLSGQGFVLSEDERKTFSRKSQRDLIRPYIIGRDLTRRRQTRYVIDTFGLTEAQLLEYPDAYQWLATRVKPERLQNPRPKYAREWWIHSEPRRKFRGSLKGLTNIIVTSRTARHRFFELLDATYLPETKVLIIALEDPFYLGLLSSRVHVAFANRTGGWLGVGNDSTYNHSICFEAFPIPHVGESLKQRVRELAEKLDSYRKRTLQEHPALTMTAIYGVLAKLQTGECLSDEERHILEEGLVIVLKEIHDQLDKAVCDCYGLSDEASEDEILKTLFAMNAERADQESQGKVRWLRPDFQIPAGERPMQQAFEIAEEQMTVEPAAASKVTKEPWPSGLPDRIRAVRAVLSQHGGPATTEDVAKRFSRAPKATVAELLETLFAVGQARRTDDGRYVA